VLFSSGIKRCIRKNNNNNNRKVFLTAVNPPHLLLLLQMKRWCAPLKCFCSASCSCVGFVKFAAFFFLVQQNRHVSFFIFSTEKLSFLYKVNRVYLLIFHSFPLFLSSTTLEEQLQEHKIYKLIKQIKKLWFLYSYKFLMGLYIIVVITITIVAKSSSSSANTTSKQIRSIHKKKLFSIRSCSASILALQQNLSIFKVCFPVKL